MGWAAEVATAGLYEERGCSVVVLVRWGQGGGVVGSRATYGSSVVVARQEG